MKLFGKVFTFNGFDVIHKGDLKVLTPIYSEYDPNGIPTVASYKRGDGRLFLKVTLSTLVNNAYQNVTVTNYAEDGITIESENTYNISVV